MKHWTDRLVAMGACQEAVDWSRGFPTFRSAWLASERGDHMLWLAARSGVDRKLVVLAACACARLALKHVPKGEDRPRIAIETAERWAKGEATLNEVRKASSAAYAAYSAASSSAAYAAYSAASSSAAYAAATAVAAAYAADAAATATATAAAKTKTLKKCAKLVRETITAARVQRAWRGK